VKVLERDREHFEEAWPDRCAHAARRAARRELVSIAGAVGRGSPEVAPCRAGNRVREQPGVVRDGSVRGQREDCMIARSPHR